LKVTESAWPSSKARLHDGEFVSVGTGGIRHPKGAVSEVRFVSTASNSSARFKYGPFTGVEPLTAGWERIAHA